jgi:hypothetical protein
MPRGVECHVTRTHWHLELTCLPVCAERFISGSDSTLQCLPGTAFLKLGNLQALVKIGATAGTNVLARVLAKCWRMC